MYGFGRNAYQAHGHGGVHYELFARRIEGNKHSPRWTTRLSFWARAMVLDDQEQLFAAGPPVEKYLSTGPVDNVADPDVVETWSSATPWDPGTVSTS